MYQMDAEKVQEEMSKRCWHQMQLAKAAGVSQRSVSNWLRYPERIKVIDLGKIADALGMSARTLIIYKENGE